MTERDREKGKERDIQRQIDRELGGISILCTMSGPCVCLHLQPPHNLGVMSGGRIYKREDLHYRPGSEIVTCKAWRGCVFLLMACWNCKEKWGCKTREPRSNVFQPSFPSSGRIANFHILSSLLTVSCPFQTELSTLYVQQLRLELLNILNSTF